MEAYLGSKKLENFLGEEEVVCREERQFAALLYSAFLDEKRGRRSEYTNDIVSRCLGLEKDVFEIRDVYFEATLMRDYFRAVGKKDNNNRMTEEEKREKKEFNERLLQFCFGFLDKDCKNTTVEEIKNLLDKEKQFHHFFGHINKYPVLEWMNSKEKEIKEQIKVKAGLDIARMMMNATPDILVIYKMKDDDKTYAKALECKYESDEGRYADVAGVNVKMQYFIQECVMSFLFGSIDNIDKEKYKAHLPKFPENPENSSWKGNKDLGEKIYGQVYNNILNQEWGNNKIKNKGISVIRFCKDEEDAQKPKAAKHKKDSSEIQKDSSEIQIKELLENMYIKKFDNDKEE